jgi:hypothetical protein
MTPAAAIPIVQQRSVGCVDAQLMLKPTPRNVSRLDEFWR